MHQPTQAWYKWFVDYVATLGFSYSTSDHSLFIYRQGTAMAYILLYVDDIILTTSLDDFCMSIISLLSFEFVMTDLGSLSYFLGIVVTPQACNLFYLKKSVLQR